MESKKLIEIAIKHGHEVNEYRHHYSIRSSWELDVIITLPKATYLSSAIVDFIKELLKL